MLNDQRRVLVKFSLTTMALFTTSIASSIAMEPQNENPEVGIDEIFASLEKTEPDQEKKGSVQAPLIKVKQPENTNECVICNKTCEFNSLKRHYAALHKLDSKIYYTCMICATEINHSSTMKSHLIKHHQIANDNATLYYKRSIKLLGTNP